MNEEWDERFESVLRPTLPDLASGVALPPDASLLDLGLDSMNMISLLVALEDEYEVSIPENRLTLETFSTARTLSMIVDELVNEKQLLDNG